MPYAKIVGTGSFLPEKILTNAELEKLVDTSHDWIVERSGIEERHIVAEDEDTRTMALAATKEALKSADMEAAELDLILVATVTPAQFMPSTACLLQESLGVSGMPAFDLNAACSGFIYALVTANSMIRSGQIKNALIVGSDCVSRLTDWTDRGTCILFGDGAGAAVLKASDEPGIIATHMGADGTCTELLHTSGRLTGFAHKEGPSYIQMQGREVFKRAVKTLEGMVRDMLLENNITGNDIDWLVVHQANIRIIEKTAQLLDMSMDRVILTIQGHGNTSAASIPLALDAGIKEGKIKPGDTIFCEGFGAGLTWGAALLKL